MTIAVALPTAVQTPAALVHLLWKFLQWDLFARGSPRRMVYPARLIWGAGFTQGLSGPAHSCSGSAAPAHLILTTAWETSVTPIWQTGSQGTAQEHSWQEQSSHWNQAPGRGDAWVMGEMAQYGHFAVTKEQKNLGLWFRFQKEFFYFRFQREFFRILTCKGVSTQVVTQNYWHRKKVPKSESA